MKFPHCSNFTKNLFGVGRISFHVMFGLFLSEISCNSFQNVFTFPSSENDAYYLKRQRPQTDTNAPAFGVPIIWGGGGGGGGDKPYSNVKTS
jgi:hypothetical protein